jgi:hypothetical protein
VVGRGGANFKSPRNGNRRPSFFEGFVRKIYSFLQSFRQLRALETVHDMDYIRTADQPQARADAYHQTTGADGR